MIFIYLKCYKLEHEILHKISYMVKFQRIVKSETVFCINTHTHTRAHTHTSAHSERERERERCLVSIFYPSLVHIRIRDGQHLSSTDSSVNLQKIWTIDGQKIYV
jgi:hypothetical protein